MSQDMSQDLVRISHPKFIFPIQVHSSGLQEWNQGASILSFLDEKDNEGFSSITMELDPSNCHFNRIEIYPMLGEEDYFPDRFRIEISQDGKYWEPIIQESGFRRSRLSFASWNFSLTSSRFIKFVARRNRKTNSGKFKTALGEIKIMISGIGRIQVSSELDRLRVKENIIDERPDYGWASQASPHPSEEFLIMDFQAIHRMEEIRMLTSPKEPVNFPNQFSIYYSEDDLAWHQLMEEPDFDAEPATWYRWRFLPINARYLKILMKDNPQEKKQAYTKEIIEIEVYASSGLRVKEGKATISEPLPYASVLRSGIVRLAVDGESREGVAVQANDRRLREATTEYKGIVELATDGEDREGVVVQGNDRRLKHATEQTYGLVRLARSGENREKVVVQGNDERLRLATTTSPGIVELAEDGETRPGVVVQGNDSRLKKATRKEYGLVILSELGGSIPDRVVTADDPRLRDATTEAKGIVRLAYSGEESPNACVQGNDKRLKKATTESFGIVQLARSGESAPGVVVQGDDIRLKKATTESAGIVLLANPGVSEAGKVVQSNDPRLSDPRTPLPHEHDYAPKNHDFSSHTGLIRLTGNTEAEAKGIFPPHSNQSVIYGKNENPKGAGIVGIGGKEGVVGFGQDSGIIGYSEKDHGVLGASKKGFGGEFVSQSHFALFVNGKGNNAKNIPGSGKALLVDGYSQFHGLVEINNSEFICIAKTFQLDLRDVLDDGDVVVFSPEAGKVSKSRSPYSTNIAGVLVQNASILLGQGKQGNDQGLVAIAGIVKVNVDPSMGSIMPGDLLVSGLTAGHAIKADPNRLKIGSLLGKALQPAIKEKTKIQVLLTFG